MKPDTDREFTWINEIKSVSAIIPLNTIYYMQPVAATGSWSVNWLSIGMTI